LKENTQAERVTAVITNWKRSKRSGAKGNCVEIGTSLGGTGIRDSKAPEAGEVRVSHVALAHFISFAAGMARSSQG
jgi:hypothetical protein